MNRRRDLYRELVNAEQALADVKAQLAYEQASRRRSEAEYRAEAEEAIADAWDEGACAAGEALGRLLRNDGSYAEPNNPYRKDIA